MIDDRLRAVQGLGMLQNCRFGLRDGYSQIHRYRCRISGKVECVRSSATFIDAQKLKNQTACTYDSFENGAVFKYEGVIAAAIDDCFYIPDLLKEVGAVCSGNGTVCMESKGEVRCHCGKIENVCTLISIFQYGIFSPVITEPVGVVPGIAGQIICPSTAVKDICFLITDKLIVVIRAFQVADTKECIQTGCCFFKHSRCEIQKDVAPGIGIRGRTFLTIAGDVIATFTDTNSLGV